MLHAALVIGLGFGLLLGSLYFLHYAQKENLSKWNILAARVSSLFAVLLILGVLVGGIIKMACHGCHGKSDKCNTSASCSSEGKGSCEKPSGNCHGGHGYGHGKGHGGACHGEMKNPHGNCPAMQEGTEEEVEITVDSTKDGKIIKKEVKVTKTI
jgi:hypothetical protein